MSQHLIRTSCCSEFDHPEFRIVYDDNLVTEADVTQLVTELEEALARGDRFDDGSSFRVGWVATRLRMTDEGTLAVFEPDMIHTPVWRVDSVNHSLIHRRLQRGVCSSVLQSPTESFPSTEDTAQICDRFGDSGFFIMERTTEKPPKSGWRFLCQEDDHDHSEESHLIEVPLYEVVVGYEPRVIPYLALPAETRVAVDASGPTIMVGGEPASFRSGSLLAVNFPSDESR